MWGDWDKDLKEELKNESVNVNTKSLLDLMHTYLLFLCLLWLTLPKCVSLEEGSACELFVSF